MTHPSGIFFFGYLLSWRLITATTEAWIFPRTLLRKSSKSSSSLLKPRGDDAVLPRIESIVTTGLSSEEVDVLQECIGCITTTSPESADSVSSLSYCGNDNCSRLVLGSKEVEAVPGATGRVVVVGVKKRERSRVADEENEGKNRGNNDGEEETETEETTIADFQVALLDQWNDYLLSRASAKGVTNQRQPFLLLTESSDWITRLGLQSVDDDGAAIISHLHSIVAEQVETFGLRNPIVANNNGDDELSCCNNNHHHKQNNDSNNAKVAAAIVPSTQHYKVDGSSNKSVLILDDLISDDLCDRLFRVLSGHNEKNDDDDDGDNKSENKNGLLQNRHHWDDTIGPDPARWIRGGLVDNIEISEEDDKDREHEGLLASREESKQEQNPVVVVGGGNFGLTNDATEDLCYNTHPALQEVERLLSDLFPSVLISRLEGYAMGEPFVTPLTANAAVHGDIYEPHIDADPNNLPPSPWTDVFGRYPNRSAGKPRLVTCLVYLTSRPAGAVTTTTTEQHQTKWKWKEWGGPTRVFDSSGRYGDPATTRSKSAATYFEIDPIPGRMVIMDQDVVHSVVAPNASAGKRPRYSLVWKLIMHPLVCGQDVSATATLPILPTRDTPKNENN